MPNAYSEFVIREQARRGWSNVQLADHAGLSKQVVGDVVNDEREILKQRPDSKTVAGLAKAFGYPEVAVWEHVVRAMGIPLAAESTLVVELESASDADLLRVLADRLAKAGTGHVAQPDQKTDDDADVVELPRAARKKTGGRSERDPNGDSGI